MSRKVRRCDSRCHSAKYPKCKCWCGGAFHGTAGAINREALLEVASEPDKLREMFAQHGFKNGLTKYVEEPRLIK